MNKSKESRLDTLKRLEMMENALTQQRKILLDLINKTTPNEFKKIQGNSQSR